MNFTKFIALTIAVLSLNAAHADSYVSSGDVKTNITPKLAKKQPDGGSCIYANQVMKLGDSITLTSIGITQICAAGDNGPKLVVVAKEK